MTNRPPEPRPRPCGRCRLLSDLRREGLGWRCHACGRYEHDESVPSDVFFATLLAIVFLLACVAFAGWLRLAP